MPLAKRSFKSTPSAIYGDAYSALLKNIDLDRSIRHTPGFTSVELFKGLTPSVQCRSFSTRQNQLASHIRFFFEELLRLQYE